MIKNIDILEEIKNRRSGIHYIKLEYKEELSKLLRLLSKKNILSKYKMSYVYRELGDSILLVIHKSLDELIQY